MPSVLFVGFPRSGHSGWRLKQFESESIRMFRNTGKTSALHFRYDANLNLVRRYVTFQVDHGDKSTKICNGCLIDVNSFHRAREIWAVANTCMSYESTVNANVISRQTPEPIDNDDASVVSGENLYVNLSDF